MYGLSPDTLSRTCSLEETIALSQAAGRFLATISGPLHHLPMKKPVAEPDIRGPDIAGFREIYGSHFKHKL